MIQIVNLILGSADGRDMNIHRIISVFTILVMIVGFFNMAVYICDTSATSSLIISIVCLIGVLILAIWPINRRIRKKQ